MRFRTLLMAALLLLPICAFATEEEARIEDALYLEVNRVRRDAGLSSLEEEATLMEAAGRFARAQAAKDAMGHASTEELRALLQVSYSVGENVAYFGGRADAHEIAKKIVDAWMKSPGHHANMMRADDTALGLGVAFGSSGRVYISFLVGKPFADAKRGRSDESTVPKETSVEAGLPDLPYSEESGGDPLEMRAITGPGHIVYGFNRDLAGAARLKVVPARGKSGANEVVMVDREGNVVKGKGLVRIYAKVPANAARPIVLRMDGKEVHCVEVPGTGYIWFTGIL